MIDLTTPSGYLVSFKDHLTTAGYRATQKAMAAHISFDPNNPDAQRHIPAVAALDAADAALKHLVLSVTFADGSRAPDPVLAIGEMPQKDGDAVYAKIDELTAIDSTTGDDAKNATAVSSASLPE